MLFNYLNWGLVGFMMSMPSPYAGPSVIASEANREMAAEVMLVRDGEEMSGANRHNRARRWDHWDENYNYGYGPYHGPKGYRYGYDHGYYGPSYGLGLSPHPYYSGPSFGVYVNP